MTKKETIQVLQSIEDRAVDFPYMTACDWVAIAAVKRHLENSLEVKEVDLEKDVDTILSKVKGFLVRDKDDYTAIYAEKPHRGKTEWVDGNDSCLMTINDAKLVPDIEFEDEPVEVEVVIKARKGE